MFWHTRRSNQLASVDKKHSRRERSATFGTIPPAKATLIKNRLGAPDSTPCHRTATATRLSPHCRGILRLSKGHHCLL
ncbi:hypothetical protein B0G74_1123 [Paraburkholderia sp. BL9I2N2]|nr:hypothetical protein B0G74_1123 [Paraburkholderia sp. BL9I2N2]